ncbi:rhodanese-related sulfurtransferase [Aurantiacibacter gangjinensis]|uniref:tRNA uridine(34) hydroxylase n=1 Tax=Aurantiacibacter gangjinensis TaxID=502682 RepID=A0A0G9MMS9_9SPHN|nr:rhodanese-related sulfurtransferase [Aurantiacibacter gangjinensis]APE28075.1 Rhodanese domain protein UPF0176, cyanobacterial/alphaproteobacterial subgroup [Aurantiacibacter gangjinensis]KLE32000.1 hypothetical protein AAW01_11260 [Aurantiacibacter gangjinensis]
MSEAAAPIQVAALYKFTRFDEPAALKPALESVCRANGVKGTLLLAPEGINGTIAAAPEAIASVLRHIRTLPGCADIEVKFSEAEAMPFLRMKVRLKREIVTMGQPDIDPLTGVGHYVAPEDWNALIADPDTVVIDTRNDYEVATGTFKGAINPETESFRDFPEWFRANREALLGEGKARRVAMFCTGGIRCEKSTAFLKSEGVEEVYHLKGGILKYLESVSEAESSWNGECFVFDQRVTVGHGLAPGSYALCHACRLPVAPSDMQSPRYEEGVSCPACFDTRTDEQRAGYRTRHRQEMLARERGTKHLGAEFADQSDD